MSKIRLTKVEEVLMSIQTLGKLLEAHRTQTGTDLEGKPTTAPYPKSIMDSSDRLKIQAKIVELVNSLSVLDTKEIVYKEKDVLSSSIYENKKNPYVGSSTDTVKLNKTPKLINAETGNQITEEASKVLTGIDRAVNGVI